MRLFQLLLLALVFSLAFDSYDADARPRRSQIRRGKKCRCSSGSGLRPPNACKGYSPAVQKMFVAQRGQMISCCRPPKNQAKLRACFNRCGQRGRAASSSNHSLGRACDVRAGGIARKYGLRMLRHHGANHVSTTGR